MDQQIKEKIFNKAISLEKYGINNLAWNKEDAIALIDSIMCDKVGILGGDVYKLSSRRLEPLYDNWSFEPFKNESQKEYHLRSKIESLKYIKSYPIQLTEIIIFSIIFTEEIK